MKVHGWPRPDSTVTESRDRPSLLFPCCPVLKDLGWSVRKRADRSRKAEGRRVNEPKGVRWEGELANLLDSQRQKGKEEENLFSPGHLSHHPILVALYCSSERKTRDRPFSYRNFSNIQQLDKNGKI